MNRIPRRDFLIAAGALVAAPLAAAAQQADRMYRIGVLFPEEIGALTVKALREGLQELGWFEGSHLSLILRSAEGDPERLLALARELARMPVDVIVVSAVQASLAAKRATSDVPIVSVYTFDPLAAGVVANLAKPGGNVTGLSAMSSDYVGKMLQVLGEIEPRTDHIAVLGDSRNPSYATYWRELSALSPKMTLLAYPVRRTEEIRAAFTAIATGSSTALFVMHQPFMWVHRQQIADLALSHRLIAVYGDRAYADSGGLVSYGANLISVWKRAAVYVDKILKGAKPADLPVEQPSKFELVINLKTAKALGLRIPQTLLARADEVIR